MVIPDPSYDEIVKIVRVSHSDPSGLFTCPPVPGDHYPIQLELYDHDKLVERQQTNITNILGEDFVRSNVNVLNGLDQMNSMPLYEFQF